MYYYTYIIISEMPHKPYYYYGRHKTDNLEDGYFGSGGRKFKNCLNKYGTGAFRKEILNFYNNEKDLEFAEKELVDILFLAFCVSRRLGMSTGDLIFEMELKFAINKNRIWKKINNHYRHI